MRLTIDLPGGLSICVEDIPDGSFGDLVFDVVDDLEGAGPPESSGTTATNFDVDFESESEPDDEAQVGGSHEGRTFNKKIREKPLRYQILRTVANVPGSTAAEISDKLDGESAKAVTSALADIKQYGWLERYGQGGVRDSYCYRITPRGRRTMDAYKSRFEQGFKHLPNGYIQEAGA